MFYSFLSAIGWRTLTEWDLFMIAMLGGAVAMVMAFVADIMLKSRSYGMIGNGLIMVIGAIAGLFLLSVVDFAPTRRIYMHAVFACLVSAVLLLLAAAAVRRPV
jgi:uncharacterized membrane protein YeaQ/YmgE (transglycosylase-associated protein family)